jgi:hypothetical protein
MKGLTIPQRTEFKKFELENRAVELDAINKAKAKLKVKGKYCHITKYFPNFIPKETLIFIPKGKDEEKIVTHFVEKRKHYFPNYN